MSGAGAAGAGGAADPLGGLYRELILDHARRRDGEGELSAPDAERFERNPTCGDEVTVQVRLEPGTDRVAELGWRGQGCSISLASASVLSGLAPGRTVGEARALIDGFREMARSRGAGTLDEERYGDAVAFEGVSRYVMRVKCAMLPWVALEACLADLA